MAFERKLNKMRSLTSFNISRISTSALPDDHDMKLPAFAPGHARDSSTASSSSSPLTPTFSTRSHGRWPSSCSSLASAPDSPVNVAKATLEDLVEEAAEREEQQDLLEEPEQLDDEPFCICDTPYCEHRRTIALPVTSLSTPFPEWTCGDDTVYDFAPPTPASKPRMKRSSSTEFISGNFTSRRRSRWHSLSSRWQSRRPTLSVSSQTVRSAPPTPGANSRRPSASQSLMCSLDSRQTAFRSNSQGSIAADKSWTASVTELIEDAEPDHLSVHEPIDREALSSTPLLPHLLEELRDAPYERVQSPLQSPSVATHDETASLANVSVCSPLPTGLMTPPLSAKPSVVSMGASRPATSQPADDSDEWSIKLGHANFSIEPRPYYPTTCTADTCKRLLEDWETARVEYMRTIARVSEHYGPSSPTYALTEEKWAAIDRQWRTNFESANAKVEANGETPVSQTLAETQPLAKMPSLGDPDQPAKFLGVSEDEIVGPMVQYVKISQPPSPKRNGFFSMFKEPGQLFKGTIFASKD